MAPTTVEPVSSVVNDLRRRELTIELMKVVHTRLECRASMLFVLEQAHLFSLPLVILEHPGDGHEEERCHDRKGSNGPSPRAAGEIRLRRQRTSECRDDERRGDEGPGQSTVLEARSVRDENVQNQIDRIVPNPIQDVSGGVAVGPVARRDDNDADEVNSKEDQQAFRTAPDIEYLCDRKLQHASNDGSEDLSGGESGRRLKVGVGLVRRGGLNALLEGQHEKAQPDPGEAAVESCLVPDQSGGLGFLDTQSYAFGKAVRMLFDFLLILRFQAESVGVGTRGVDFRVLIGFVEAHAIGQNLVVPAAAGQVENTHAYSIDREEANAREEIGKTRSALTKRGGKGRGRKD